MKTVYVLNGPNLNLIGTREAGEDGQASLGEVEQRLRDRAGRAALDIVFLQSNHEGDLIDWIQEAGAAGAPVILNAGAYSHTSVALHDAIRGARARVIEVHMANAHARTMVRHRFAIAPMAEGIIMGFGVRSYELALEALLATEVKPGE